MTSDLYITDLENLLQEAIMALEENNWDEESRGGLVADMQRLLDKGSDAYQEND
jgi:hypothetical protein